MSFRMIFSSWGRVVRGGAAWLGVASSRQNIVYRLGIYGRNASRIL